MISEVFYRVGVDIYHLLIRLYARFGNQKAKAWINGRREPVDWSKLDAARHKGPTVWMHCASLGEWEQGRPVLESLAEALDHKLAIVLTFYSPSGYEKAHSYTGADLVTYLPQDNPNNAKAFQSKVSPDLALFVKYEFWYYHLTQLKKDNVPIYLVAGAFRSGQLFFNSFGAWWRKMLRRIDLLLVQTQQDRVLLDKILLPPEQVIVTGDPRVDRTMQIASQDWSDDIISAFADDSRLLLIAGSVWAADVQRLRGAWPSLKKYYKLLLVPHEITKQNMFDWSRDFKAQRYTQVTSPEQLKSDVLILDTVGMLSKVYRYGHVAMIGGGFGASIHNTLEPMAYGLPVLFGPRIHKFNEALSMVEQGGAFVVETPANLQNTAQDLTVDQNYLEAKAQVEAYMSRNSGATQRSVNAIIENWKRR
ncbi:MAG: glycosyltransferase N-terminal domain-containing protein [Bacteroidota bacterium]